MRETVGVSILTSGNRMHELQACISSFISGTLYRPLTIAIVDNGSTDGTSQWLTSLEPMYGVSFIVKTLPKDLGCAAGSNVVAGLVSKFKYALHIESDFTMLPAEVSKEDGFWLNRAVEFMDDGGECDYLYLRRMVDEEDIRLHWWAKWMTAIDSHTGKYMRCPGFMWSNNPHLRNNAAIMDARCLPLVEGKDGPKGTPNWCRPELEAAPPRMPWIHRWGLFVHEPAKYGGIKAMTAREGCDMTEFGCKYGFFKEPAGDLFCRACSGPESDFTDMQKHYGRMRH